MRSSEKRFSPAAAQIAPALLGFVAPVIALFALRPQFVLENREVFAALLVIAFVITMCLLLLAAALPRRIIAAAFSADGERLLIQRANAVSSSVEDIPARAIISAKTVRTYDADGYPEDVVDVELAGGRVIRVPANASFAP
ncbi:MAG: hypothetical protein ACFCUN_06445 [Hyphomicrobiaceae bacterium]